mgnify:CR=1 FL=1
MKEVVMGSTQKPPSLKEVEQVMPTTPQEKAKMEQPYIYKPVPDMYLMSYLDCSSKSVRSILTVRVGCRRVSRFVTGSRTRGLSLSRLSLRPRIRRMCCVCVGGVRRGMCAIMRIRST